MSNQLILEIQEFNGGQDFKIGIQSFAFSQHAHINRGMAGTAQKMSEELREMTAVRSIDRYSALFVNQQGKTFPKMTLTPERSREEKSFIFTFYEVQLTLYSIERSSRSNETVEILSFSFSKFSAKETSPKAESTVHNQRPKTADKHREQLMNYIKG